MKTRSLIRYMLATYFLSMPLFATAQQQHDTILLGAIADQGQLYGMIFIPEVEVFGQFMDPKRREEIRRLRYNVFKVYPYAVTAAYVLEQVDKETSALQKKKDRKSYLKRVEKEMNAKFKNELKDLSISQGQILVKLINRETGKDCYSVIKDLKGGLNARIYQTAAQLFDNSLKSQYDPYGKDKDIEMIVQEIESKNYYNYQYKLQQQRIGQKK